MSFTPLMGLIVARITESLPPNSTVIELGNQTLKMSDEILDEVISSPPRNANISALQKIRALKIKQRGDKTADYYKSLGFSEYAAIDVNDKYGSLMMDLNLEIKQHYGFTKQYDLVTNNGTGEHLFNQYAVFKNCHDLAKVNGIILFILPFSGWVNHGFFNFHPPFDCVLLAQGGKQKERKKFYVGTSSSSPYIKWHTHRPRKPCWASIE